MRVHFIVLMALTSLSSCTAPILFGQEQTAIPVRSTAFGPYPEIDRKRCEALTQEQADNLYQDIMITGRCNPNNHHTHHGNHNHGHVLYDETDEQK